MKTMNYYEHFTWSKVPKEWAQKQAYNLCVLYCDRARVQAPGDDVWNSIKGIWINKIKSEHQRKRSAYLREQ